MTEAPWPGSPSFFSFKTVSLLEPSKKLDKGQLLWDLLSQFVSPAVEAMKEVRMSMMAKLLALQKKKA
jgi:hypothetical protein